MFKYKILKYSIIVFISIIFLLLLRITYKPLDVSFLNSNSIKLKDYIGNFENISTEKIVLDFDLLKWTNISLLGPDNFFAIANVEFRASVIPSKFSQADNFNGIVGLIVEQGEEGIYYLNLQANPRLPRAMGDIEGALFFATLDASQVGFVITLNNDTR